MLLYWFLFPLLLGATFAGLGLGVRRLSVPFAAPLLVPVGYCVAIVVSAAVTYSGHTTDATGPVVALLALAGWAFSARDIWAALKSGALRRAWPWMTAGVLGFLVFGAAVITSGQPSYTGYNEIVDIASQMDWASYLADFGRHQVGTSSLINSHNGTPLNGYPGGPQALLGTFPGTFGFAMPWAWDPYLAIMAGSIIAGAYALIQMVTPSRTFAAIGAFAVGQASPLIGYGHIGGIKEISAVVTILAAGALLPTAASPDGTKPWRAAIPLSVAFAGAFSVFSLTILPWLGILGGGALIVVWRSLSLRTALIRGGTALAIFALITLPTSIPSKDSFRFAEVMLKEVGNLAHPVSLWSATGVWITDDHRFALGGAERVISIVIGIVVIALVGVGLWHAWRTKVYSLLTLWIASIVGMTLLLVRMGPWVDFKGMTLAAPAMLLLAVIGLASLRTFDKKPLAWAAWAGVAGLLLVGLVSDGLRYGSTQTAPHDRLSELRHYGHEFAGAKSTLIPDWDENGGHEMAAANAVQAFNNVYPPSDDWKANPARTADQTAWDLDQISPPFVNAFDFIVMRRSPDQSRPGRAFQLREEGRFFDVWQRTTVAPTAAHLPLSGFGTPEDQAKCEAFIKGLPAAATLTIAPAPSFVATTFFDQAKTTAGMVVSQDRSVVSMNAHAGTSQGSADIGGNAGLFDVFALDSSHRSTTITVAGHEFGVELDPSAATRPQYLGTLPLGAGPQPVTLKVGGRSLRSGTSKKFNQGAWVGAVLMIPAGTLHPALVATTAGAVQCKNPIDWIETP